MTALANAQQITAALAADGFTAPQIAGIEGNLAVESGGRPDAYNPGENAHGIAQWEGGRWNALQAFARSRGTAPTDLATQLDYLNAELHGSEHAALVALAQTTTPEAAATVFDRQFERSSAASLPTRVAAAQQIAAGNITGGTGVDTGAAGSGGGVAPAGFDWNPLNWPKDAMGALGRYALDAGLVIAGLVLIIVGVLVMAKGGEDHGAPAVGVAPGSAPEAAGKHGAEGAAEDAAEVAAV